MLMEERKDVVIFKGSDEEIRQLKERTNLVRGEGVCVMAQDVPEEIKNAPKKYTANVPDDAFYKEKIKAHEKRIQELEEELTEARKTAVTALHDLHQAEQRMNKLEAAFIEAAIN